MDYLYGSNFGRVELSPGDKLSIWWKNFESAQILYGKGYVGEELDSGPAGSQLSVPAYFAQTPGYDVIVTQNITGPAIYAVAVRSEDGSFLPKHVPVVADDLITDHSTGSVESGLQHTITLGEILGNDPGSEVQVATDVQFSNFTKGLWLENVNLANEGSSLSVQLDTPSPFIGTTSFQYQVTDPFGDTSAAATVTMDWLGSNTSKADIHGTDQSDVIDFELSTGSVGVHGQDGADVIRGSQFGDSLYGDAGADRIGGKGGDDFISGGGGDDLLFGDAGNDSLVGGFGNDVLIGGQGIDRLRGGAGSDTFLFFRGEADGDTITDFEGAMIAGGDRIEFRGYGEGATLHHVSDDLWQIDAAGTSETFKILGVTELGSQDYYFA